LLLPETFLGTKGSSSRIAGEPELAAAMHVLQRPIAVFMQASVCVPLLLWLWRLL
jgi:hypothetical protein